MSTLSLTFSAGESKRVPAGNFLKIISASSTVDVELFKSNTRTGEKYNGVTEGDYFKFPAPRVPVQDSRGMLVGFDYDQAAQPAFDYAEITSASVQTIVVTVSMGEHGSDSVVGTVTANIGQGDTLTDNDGITVNTSAGVLIAADAARRAIHVRNTGAATIYLGASSVTTASAIELLPGEEFREEAGAAAAWYAIASGSASSAAVLEIN